MQARILSVRSSHCLAALGLKTVVCSFRGRLRRDSARVVPGDLVELQEKGDDLVIDKVLPRKNSLVRPRVANVDRVIVVTAITVPPVDLLYIDRILVQLEASDIDGAICINKSDLEDPREVSRVAEIYRNAGYPAVITSAAEGRGLQDLAREMVGRNVVLAGASGVGKSKLLSALSGLGIATGSLSKLGRGRHTTKGVTLYRVGESGFVADTPGFSKLDVVDCKPEDLALYYREMRDLVPFCHYPRCLHKTESECRVKEALRQGVISQARYANYLSLLEECQGRDRKNDWS